MKQIRVALIHNGTESSISYAQNLFNQIKDEVHLVDVYDKRPLRDAMPIRAVPTASVILFADTLEEQQEIANVLLQLDLIKKQDEVSIIVDELIEAAGENVPEALSEKIINTFYGG